MTFDVAEQILQYDFKIQRLNALIKEFEKHAELLYILIEDLKRIKIEKHEFSKRFL